MYYLRVLFYYIICIYNKNYKFVTVQQWTLRQTTYQFKKVNKCTSLSHKKNRATIINNENMVDSWSSDEDKNLDTIDSIESPI